MVRSAGRDWRRAVVVLLLLAAACTPSGSTYVANRDLGTYLRLPAGYTLYDHEAVVAAAGDQPSGAAGSQQWVISFDASDTPRVDAFLSQVREPGDAPAGYLRVRELRDEERLGYSLASLHSEVLSPRDMQALGDRVQILSTQELSQDGGDGLDVVWSLRLAEEPLQFEQVALVDDQTRRVYLLVVGCSAACYETHQSEIAQIVESLTVVETE